MKKILILLIATIALSLLAAEVSANTPTCLISPTVSGSAVNIRIECSQDGSYLLGVNSPTGETIIYDTFPYLTGIPYYRNFSASSVGTHRIVVFKMGWTDAIAESSFEIESVSSTTLNCGDAAQENDDRCPASDCPATECPGGSWYCLKNATECPEPDMPPPRGESWKLCHQLQEGDARGNCLSCLSSQGIWTAVGCIPTNPVNMIQVLIRIGLMIGGGVALLIILAGSFVLSTSQGDPKKTSEAKEMITSALIGLVFIIFSVSILQLIGVQILQIPGFGQ